MTNMVPKRNLNGDFLIKMLRLDKYKIKSNI